MASNTWSLSEPHNNHKAKLFIQEIHNELDKTIETLLKAKYFPLPATTTKKKERKNEQEENTIDAMIWSSHVEI